MNACAPLTACSEFCYIWCPIHTTALGKSGLCTRHHQRDPTSFVVCGYCLPSLKNWGGKLKITALTLFNVRHLQVIKCNWWQTEKKSSHYSLAAHKTHHWNEENTQRLFKDILKKLCSAYKTRTLVVLVNSVNRAGI